MLFGASLYTQVKYEFAFIGLTAFVIIVVHRSGFYVERFFQYAKPSVFRILLLLISIPKTAKHNIDSYLKRRKAQKMHQAIQEQLLAYEELEMKIEYGTFYNTDKSLISIASTPLWYTLLAFEVIVLIFFAVAFVRFFNENHGFTMFYVWQGLS